MGVNAGDRDPTIRSPLAGEKPVVATSMTAKGASTSNPGPSPPYWKSGPRSPGSATAIRVRAGAARPWPVRGRPAGHRRPRPCCALGHACALPRPTASGPNTIDTAGPAAARPRPPPRVPSRAPSCVLRRDPTDGRTPPRTRHWQMWRNPARVRRRRHICTSATTRSRAARRLAEAVEGGRTGGSTVG